MWKSARSLNARRFVEATVLTANKPLAMMSQEKKSAAAIGNMLLPMNGERRMYWGLAPMIDLCGVIVQ
jgi:hypothetical protein